MRNDDSKATTCALKNRPGTSGGPIVTDPVSVNVPGYGPVATPEARNAKVVPPGWHVPSRRAISPMKDSRRGSPGPEPRVGGAGGGAAIAPDPSEFMIKRTANSVRGAINRILWSRRVDRI